MIRALSLAGVLFLAGCMASHPPPKQFDLGEFAAPGKQSGLLAVNIIIPDVVQPSWMRTREMFYRLDYTSPAQPQPYAMSRWIATPGELVTMRLRQAVQFANTGFTLAASNRAAGYLLQTDIDEFTQAFTAPAASKCILQLRASLWRVDGQIAAQREFRLEIPAPTPDATGAARCLAAAVDQASGEMVQWLRGAIATAP